MNDEKHQDTLTALKAVTTACIPKRADPQAKNITKNPNTPPPRKCLKKKAESISPSRGAWENATKLEQTGRHGEQSEK